MRSSARTLSIGLTLALGASVGLAATPVAAQSPCADPTGPADPPAVTGGDMALAAAQPGPAPAATPVHCWTGASGDAVRGARAVAAGDLVITLSDAGEVVAFLPDGSEAFRVTVTGIVDVPPGGHTTDGERVYVGIADAVVALAVDDGREAWRLPISTANTSGATGAGRPAVIDGAVFVVISESSDRRAVERSLVALDAADGSERWRQPLFAEFPAGPVAVDAERVVLWDGMGTVRSFDPASGVEQWATGIDVLGIIATGPVAMADGFVATILSGGEVVVLSAVDGGKVWSATPDPALAAAVAIHDGTLLVNDVTKLLALDLATGEERWSAAVQERAAPFPHQPVPAVADGLVILGTSDVSAEAALVAWDAATGEERWRAPTKITGAILSPIVSGGRVYAAALDLDQDGGLVAFGVAGG